MRNLCKIFAVLFLNFQQYHFGSTKSQNNEIENEQIKCAEEIYSYMNTSVNPCDDFYKYACARYNKPEIHINILNLSIPIEPSRVIMNERIHELLMEPINSDDMEVELVLKVKSYYQSCIKADIFNYKKSEEYLKLIDSLGGWPALHSTWKPENFDWRNITFTLHKYGLDFVFNELKLKGINESMIYFSSVSIVPELFIDMNLEDLNSQSFLMNKNVAYHIMNTYGISKQQAEKSFDEAIAFARIFASLKRMKLKGFEYNHVPVTDLQKFYSDFEWINYYSQIYPKDELSRILVKFRDNFNRLNDVSNIFHGKNIKGAANYLILRILSSLHGEIYSHQNLKSYCIEMIENIFTPAMLTTMYLDSIYYDEDIETAILDLGILIKKSFVKLIESNKRISNSSLSQIVNIMKNLTIGVQDTKYSTDLYKFSKYFTNLDIKPENSFYENNLAILCYRKNFSSDLSYTFNRTLEDTFDYSFQSRYAEESNKLLLSPGVFQKTYYNLELPKAYNFGAMGSIIGFGVTKALVHIYNRKNIDVKTLYENENLDNCLLEKHGINDDMGLRSSFHAYKKWFSNNEGSLDINKLTLPQLNVTDKQLFFLSFAQMICKRPLYYDSGYFAHILYNKNADRIIRILTNFHEFSSAFNCPLDSPMNPEDKCELL